MTANLFDPRDAHLEGMPSWATGSHGARLLLHVEVRIWVLDVAHVGALLLDTQPLASICVLSLSPSTVVALLTSHCEVVEALGGDALIVRTVLRVGAHHQVHIVLHPLWMRRHVR